MKRFYSIKAKILLAIACIFFTVCFLVSIVASYIIGAKTYHSDGSTTYSFRKEVFDDAGKAYAVLALSKYDSGFNTDLLNGMNCYYGVIDGAISEDADLNDNSIYLYRNFAGVSVPSWNNELFINSYTVNDKTVFNRSEQFLGMFGAQNSILTDTSRREEVFEVQGIGYDTLGSKAYAYANDRFFALDSFWYGRVMDDYVAEAHNMDSTFSKIWSMNNTNGEEATEENEKLFIAGNAYDPISKSIEDYKLCLNNSNGEKGILDGDYVADLSPIHDTLKDIDSFDAVGTRFTYFNDPPKIRSEVENSQNKRFTFICFPNEAKLSTKGHANDYYAKAKKIVSVAYTIKPFVPIVSIISFVMIWVCFGLFIKAAGHTKQSKKIVAGPFDWIPVDLAFIATVALELIFLVIIAELKNRLDYLPFYKALVGIGGSFILGMAVGLCFCSLFAVNFKLCRLHKNMFIIRLLMKVGWKARIWISYMMLPLILIMINVALEWYVGVWFDGLFVYLMDKVVLAAFIFWGIRSYSKIKDSAEKLAAGDMTAHVDVRGMPQFMEETGTALNDIQAGIEIALAERTKSERMKTELITNVSHDIKTPITSIINYVDLLDKENLENENAKEYLEVLNRQSLRLKKLVEDIIEASKISSGNIELNMEEVNAEVLLDQSIGEFAERLKEKKIEVVVNSCDSEMHLIADNRYLWRVFDNIMSNIVKYAQADTRAYVDLENNGDKLRFTFRNTSREQLNISPEELMERFVRGDKSRYTDGNGLGLSIAHSLTEAMGGTMNIFIDGDFFKVILEFDAIIENVTENED
ncbi:sensor histidine kinase [Butyrivibrio sp. AE2005]|uniref:sensor histidine kinase n=1 Tax=Butyrivibrio sp. AE2005 TaxID=1496722 RepID=UPI0006898DD0|nr:HAMP domain-containing sensor histidine kinase [Butyrivibrio sp. AE2005]